LGSSFFLVVILRSKAEPVLSKVEGKNLVVCGSIIRSDGILRSLWSLRMTDLTGRISNAIALVLKERSIAN
jgi:hypothetical protein